MNNLPKYYETFIPILTCLEEGKPIHYSDLYKFVMDRYYKELPETVLNMKLKSGGLLILNRIGWGKSYLKLGKYIDYPDRGLVQITSKGLNVLKHKSLSFNEFKNDPDFISHKSKKVKEKQQDVVEDTLESETPEDLIESGINLIESKVKAELLEKLKNIDPYFFQEIILRLLKSMGYGEFLETPKSRDGGIDGIINQDFLGLEKIYIQAKRYNENKIRELDIRNFIGAMSGDTSKGVFVTTSSFDESAIKKALKAHHKISLIDGTRLVELMIQHKVGIKVRETYEIKEIDMSFFEGY